MSRQAHKCPRCNENTIYFDGICFDCKAREERESFLNLTPDQIEAKVQNIVAHIEKGGKFDDVRGDFWGLFCVKGVHDPRIARAAFAHDIDWPHEIYYRAPSDVRDELLKRLEAAKDRGAANRLLCLLAMQGDEKVLETFYDMEKNPREWRKKLYVGPSFYAQIGGWSFDESGARKSLVFDKCVALQPSKDENFDMKFSLSGQKCKSCGCEIVEMLNLKASDPRLAFLGLKSDFKFHCCPNCIGMSADSFCKTDADGEVKIFGCLEDEEENYFGETDTLDRLKFKFIPHEVPRFWGHFAELDITIGGEANWVQDAVFLKCPECGETMKFIAQIPFGTLIQGEGVIFVQICQNCDIAGGCFQCT